MDKNIKFFYKKILYNFMSNLETLIKIYKIEQLYCSNEIAYLENRFINKYNLKKYKFNNKTTIFYGIYNSIDFKNFFKHKGKKIIMFNGEDIFNFLGNKNITEDLLIFTLSKSIQNLLKNNNFDSILIKDFNLLKKNLFKPLSKYGNKIYIYNGVFKESKYCGKDIYESIIESLPYFEYIFSSNLIESYDSISNIYKECFIGLRLTA